MSLTPVFPLREAKTREPKSRQRVERANSNSLFEQKTISGFFTIARVMKTCSSVEICYIALTTDDEVHFFYIVVLIREEIHTMLPIAY